MLTVGGQETDKSDMELSWEEVGESIRPLRLHNEAWRVPSSRSLTPLSASPGLRKDHANETTSETFLSAVLRASPSRGKGDGRQSGTASPLSRSLLRGSPNASRSASLRLLPGDAPSPKTNRSRNGQQSSPAPGPSPLASRRPYVMTSTAETSPQAQSQIDQVPAPAPQSPHLTRRSPAMAHTRASRSNCKTSSTTTETCPLTESWAENIPPNLRRAGRPAMQNRRCYRLRSQYADTKQSTK
ncbi:hypothetical protein L7F22_049963 [Adiantum nelumboides]|nr:hypothetical protein [Adiantum nelumboides]